MQGKPRFCYGSSPPWELLWANGGGGEGVCEGCPAWLFSLSHTFPMWFCICVFDHVNPCLAPTPTPSVSLPHTPQRLTEIDSPLYPTDTPPPHSSKMARILHFSLEQLTPLPEKRIKYRAGERFPLTVCSTSLRRSGD